MSWQQAYISMLFDAHTTCDSDLDEFAVDQAVSTYARTRRATTPTLQGRPPESVDERKKGGKSYLRQVAQALSRPLPRMPWIMDYSCSGNMGISLSGCITRSAIIRAWETG